MELRRVTVFIALAVLHFHAALGFPEKRGGDVSDAEDIAAFADDVDFDVSDAEDVADFADVGYVDDGSLQFQGKRGTFAVSDDEEVADFAGVGYVDVSDAEEDVADFADVGNVDDGSLQFQGKRGTFADEAREKRSMSTDVKTSNSPKSPRRRIGGFTKMNPKQLSRQTGKEYREQLDGTLNHRYPKTLFKQFVAFVKKKKKASKAMKALESDSEMKENFDTMIKELMKGAIEDFMHVTNSPQPLWDAKKAKKKLGTKVKELIKKKESRDSERKSFKDLEGLVLEFMTDKVDELDNWDFSGMAPVMVNEQKVDIPFFVEHCVNWLEDNNERLQTKDLYRAPISKGGKEFGVSLLSSALGVSSFDVGRKVVKPGDYAAALKWFLKTRKPILLAECSTKNGGETEIEEGRDASTDKNGKRIELVNLQYGSCRVEGEESKESKEKECEMQKATGTFLFNHFCKVLLSKSGNLNTAQNLGVYLGPNLCPMPDTLSEASVKQSNMNREYITSLLMNHCGEARGVVKMSLSKSVPLFVPNEFP